MKKKTLTEGNWAKHECVPENEYDKEFVRLMAPLIDFWKENKDKMAGYKFKFDVERNLSMAETTETEAARYRYKLPKENKFDKECIRLYKCLMKYYEKNKANTSMIKGISVNIKKNIEGIE